MNSISWAHHHSNLSLYCINTATQLRSWVNFYKLLLYIGCQCTFLVMDGYDPVLNILQLNLAAPTPRVFLPRCHFEVDGDWNQRYRLQEGTVNMILERIKPRLILANRKGTISPRQQLLTALRFYSTNSFYHVVRDAHGPSESSVCRIVRRVTESINAEFFEEAIKWPANC